MAADDSGDMVVVAGCRFPARLHYDVAHHMWYEPLDGGLVRVGITCVAVALADNRIFAFTPKRVGRDLEKGLSCATIESGKWVGPARIAFDGVVVETNQDLIDRPSQLVHDTYGAGWMLIARPSADVPLADLVTGGAIEAAYAAWMQANDFPGCAAGTT